MEMGKIAMDFEGCIPKTLGKFDSIWVVVDILTKWAHFIPVKIDYNVEQFVQVYVKDTERLHRVPLTSSQIIVPNSLQSFGGNFMMN